MPSYVTTTTLQQPDGQTQEVHRSVTPAGQQTILVPGGAGYIGSHTVRQLVREGFRVVVVDSLSVLSLQDPLGCTTATSYISAIRPR